MSASSGALSVLNVQATDEGCYKCEPTGSNPYIVELKSPCEFAVVLKQYTYIYNMVCSALFLQHCTPCIVQYNAL